MTTKPTNLQNVARVAKSWAVRSGAVGRSVFRWVFDHDDMLSFVLANFALGWAIYSALLVGYLIVK